MKSKFDIYQKLPEHKINIKNLINKIILKKKLVTEEVNLLKSESSGPLNELVHTQLKGINSVIRLSEDRDNKNNSNNYKSQETIGTTGSNEEFIKTLKGNTNLLSSKKMELHSSFISKNKGKSKTKNNLLNDPRYVKFMKLKGNQTNNETYQIKIWKPSMVLSSLNLRTARLSNRIKKDSKFRLGKTLIKDLSVIKMDGLANNLKSQNNYTNKEHSSLDLMRASLNNFSKPEIKFSKGKVSLINKTRLLPYLSSADLIDKEKNQSSYINWTSLDKVPALFSNSSGKERRKLKLFKKEGKFWASNWLKKIKIKTMTYKLDDSDKILLSIIKERRMNLSKKFSGIVEPTKIRRGSGFSFINDNLLKNQFIKYKFQHSPSYGIGGELASNSLRVSENIIRKIKGMEQSPEESLKNYLPGGPWRNYKLEEGTNQIFKVQAKGLGIGPVSASHIDFESLHKLLKSFFNTLSSLISLPIIESLPDKLNIRLFYYLKGNRKENKKLRSYKNYVKNSGKLFKEIMLRALISRKVGKESLALFLSNWKLLNNERIFSGPELLKTDNYSPLNLNSMSNKEHINEKLNVHSKSKLDLLDNSLILEPKLISKSINISQPRPGSRETALIAMERLIENLNSDSEFKNLAQQNLLSDFNNSLEFNLNNSENLEINRFKVDVKKDNIELLENLKFIRNNTSVRNTALDFLEELSTEFLKIKIANPISSIVRNSFKRGPINDILREEEKLITLIAQDSNKNESTWDELKLVKKTHLDIQNLLFNLKNSSNLNSNLNIRDSYSKVELEDTKELNNKFNDNSSQLISSIPIRKGFENIKFKKLSEFILKNYLVLYTYPLLVKLNLDKFKKGKTQSINEVGNIENIRGATEVLGEKNSNYLSNLDTNIVSTSINSKVSESLVGPQGVHTCNLYEWKTYNKDFNILERELYSLMKEKNKELISLPLINTKSLHTRALYKKYLTYLIYSIYALYRSYLKTKIIREYLSKLLINYNKVSLDNASYFTNSKLSNHKINTVHHNLIDIFTLDNKLNGKLIEEDLELSLNNNELRTQKASLNKIMTKNKTTHFSTLKLTSLDPNLASVINLLKNTPYAPYAIEAINTISLIFDEKLIDKLPVDHSSINNINSISRTNLVINDLLDREIFDKEILKEYCQDRDLSNINSIINRNNFNYGILGNSGNNITSPRFNQSGAFLEEWENSIFKLNIEKIKIFVKYLEKLFNKSIQLDLTRLHYPYHESNILSQVIGKSSKSRFSKFFRMMKTLEFTASVTQPGAKLYSDTSKIRTLPSLLSGFKVKLAGRLLGDGMRPRFTVRQYQVGTLSRAKIGYKNTSRFTFKNKRGAYSLTVTMGHIFENIKNIRS
jgi:hypothetical protein